MLNENIVSFSSKALNQDFTLLKNRTSSWGTRDVLSDYV